MGGRVLHEAHDLFHIADVECPVRTDDGPGRGGEFPRASPLASDRREVAAIGSKYDNAWVLEVRDVDPSGIVERQATDLAKEERSARCVLPNHCREASQNRVRRGGAGSGEQQRILGRN